MNTLHLTCPHCKELMAVNATLLGKNVRCPHCRQVIQTPPPAEAVPTPPPLAAVDVPAPAPKLDGIDDDPTFQLPEVPKEGHDSIFGERADEDVFGSRPVKPEMPPHDATVAMSAPPTNRLEADFGVSNTVITIPDPIPEPPPAPAPFVEPLPDSTAVVAAPPMPPVREEIEPLASARPAIKKPTVPSAKGSNLFTWLLLFWALAATGAAVYFSTSKSYLHPFQAIPDVYGEYEKADRKKTISKLLPSDQDELPLQFRVPLGGSLTMNQLEIQPLQVEAGRYAYFTQKVNASPKEGSEQSCFLLKLKLKNLSADLLFHPVDPAFNRQKVNDDSGRNYNRLAIGNSVFPGGLFRWRPQDKGVIRDYLAGQERDPLPLQPGESREYVIPSQHVARLAEALKIAGKGNGLWRIQLRTGIVQVQSREVAVTSVVGVEFATGDIKTH